jgi:hypothetical protein
MVDRFVGRSIRHERRLAAGGNVRTPLKSVPETISGRESCTGATHFDDANMAESPIEITTCYHGFVASSFLVLGDLPGKY